MEAQEGFLSMSIDLKPLFGEVQSTQTAAAIGAFDGVHLGHTLILNRTVEYARTHGIGSAAVLFDPLPSQFFGRIGYDERILLQDEQISKIRAVGIDTVTVLPFTRELAETAPEEFLTAMLSSLHCKELFMGPDFSIGKNRSGSPEALAVLGNRFGFETEVVPKAEMDGEQISSTRIRSLLKQGLVTQANRMLGYPFFFTGKIIHGEARGRKLGFPTLNVRIPPEKVKLPNGVYAVLNTVEGKKYASVTNIGVRPTFGMDDRGIVVESYLLHAAGNFYGESNKLEFIEMLRPERRFDSADSLKAQISQDILQAEKILKTFL